MSQVAENTVYTFALLLAAYLVGTTLGAAAYPRLRRRCADEGALQDSLLLALAAACLVGTLSLSGAAAAKAWLSSLLPTSVAMALAAEAALAAAAFLAADVRHGRAVQPSRHASARRRLGFLPRAWASTRSARRWRRALFGVLVVPQLGTKLGLAADRRRATSRSRSRRAWRSGADRRSCGRWRLAPGFRRSRSSTCPPGGRLVSYDEGVLATVSVVEDSRGVARLHINNRQQEGSSATFYVDGRQGLLPLLLHPAPQRALFLGLGTGATAAAAAAERSLDVDVVELLPEVVAAAAYFDERASAAAPASACGSWRPTRAATCERRRSATTSSSPTTFIRRAAAPAALYTVEHFAAVRERLAPGGLFCQWLPLHQLDLATLRSIVRSFLAAFPQGTALLASYSLDTPVLGLDRRGRRRPRPRGRRAAAARDTCSCKAEASRITASATSSRCSARSSRGRARSPRSPATRR